MIESEAASLVKELMKKIPQDAVLLVEGKSDVEALRSIGVNCEILAMNSRKGTFTDLIDRIKRYYGREVIILMEFDKHGRKVTKHLVQSLEGKGVKINLYVWRRLSDLVGGEVKEVENLTRLVEIWENEST